MEVCALRGLFHISYSSRTRHMPTGTSHVVHGIADARAIWNCVTWSKLLWFQCCSVAITIAHNTDCWAAQRDLDCGKRYVDSDLQHIQSLFPSLLHSSALCNWMYANSISPFNSLSLHQFVIFAVSFSCVDCCLLFAVWWLAVGIVPMILIIIS